MGISSIFGKYESSKSFTELPLVGSLIEINPEDVYSGIQQLGSFGQQGEIQLSKVDAIEKAILSDGTIENLPPIKLVRFDGKLIVVDGHHRLLAYLRIIRGMRNKGRSSISILKINALEIDYIAYLGFRQITTEQFQNEVGMAIASFQLRLERRAQSNIYYEEM